MSDLPPCPIPLESYARALIAEECAETVQAKCKGDRFGFDHARRDGVTARALMNTEAGDVLAAIAFGMRAGVLDPFAVMAQKHAKFARLTDPAACDDEGGRLAPDLPRVAELPLYEALNNWPALQGQDALSSVVVGNLMTRALEAIDGMRVTLLSTAKLLRRYEAEHRAKGDAHLAGNVNMKESAAGGCYAKADRNGGAAMCCEEAANVHTA